MFKVRKTRQRRGKKAALSVLCAGMLVLAAGAAEPANAQQDVNDRLNRMENDIQTLSRALYRGEAFKGLPVPDDRTDTASSASSRQAAKLEVRLSQLEIELRSLTGKIEQQSFEIRKVTESVDRMLADLEMRVAELERTRHENGRAPASGRDDTSSLNSSPVNGGRSQDDTVVPLSTSDMLVQPVEEGSVAMPAPGGASPQAGNLGQLVVKDDGQGGVEMERPVAETPAGLYEQAFSLLKEKDYEQAASYFNMFLERYPAHNLASNAKYWLGETYYVRNDYEWAARVFAEAYQQYADSSKGPDSLLKLGMSLAGMGKKEEACTTYSQIERHYGSGGAGSILSRAKQEKEVLRCDRD